MFWCKRLALTGERNPGRAAAQISQGLIRGVATITECCCARALGRNALKGRILRHPSQTVSSLVHLVTHWVSVVKVSRGKARNASRVYLRDGRAAPRMVELHWLSGVEACNRPRVPGNRVPATGQAKCGRPSLDSGDGGRHNPVKRSCLPCGSISCVAPGRNGVTWAQRHSRQVRGNRIPAQIPFVLPGVPLKWPNTGIRLSLVTHSLER